MVKIFLTGRPFHELTLPVRRENESLWLPVTVINKPFQHFFLPESWAQSHPIDAVNKVTATQLSIQHTLYKH